MKTNEPIEITPQMIQAGVDALYQEFDWVVFEPAEQHDLKAFVERLYFLMSQAPSQVVHQNHEPI